MRILMTTGIFPPDIGGPASYVPKMAGELIRKGHDVQVVCLSDQVDHDDQQYSFAVHRILRGGFKPLRMLRTFWKIAGLARSTDLVYVNGLPMESALASLVVRAPCVHKVVSDYAWERATNRGWFAGSRDEYQAARKGLLLLAADFLRTFPLLFAREIVVPSQYLKRLVSGWRIRPSKVTVILNAAEPSDRQEADYPLTPFPGKTVVTISRLIPLKCIDGIIKAVHGLPETRLVIAGEGPCRASLEEQSIGLGMKDRVIFLGNVPKESILPLLRKAEAFVLNSTTEGLPHVVLEAMEMGIPVVATNTGGTKEVVKQGETGLLVEVGDTQGLRNSLAKVLNEDGLAATLVKNAQAMLKAEFSYLAMVASTESLLRFQSRAAGQGRDFGMKVNDSKPAMHAMGGDT